MLSFGQTIPVRIHPLFWLMAAAIGFISSGDIPSTAIWIVVVFVSVLVHEFGHALTALGYGQKVSIDLMALGGLTQRQGPPLPLFREFIIVLNGPLAGLALAMIAYQILVASGVETGALAYALSIAVQVNLFWTLVNLLPIQPLDGGKLFLILMEALFGLRGVKIGLFASLAFGVTLALLCFAFGILFLGAIFLMLAFESYRTWRGALVMTDRDRDHELQEQLHTAEHLITIGKTSEAERMLKSVRGKVTSGFLYLASTELLGRLAADQGDYQQAYQLLGSIESHLEDSSLILLHQLAYRTGNWQHAVVLGDRAHENNPNYEIAVVNALCHAVLGEVQAAVGWLRCAVEEGLPDVQQIIKQTEFDHIRTSPQFQAFQQTL